MRKKPIFFLALSLVLLQTGLADTSSLSHPFLLGNWIKDLDKDGFGEKVSFRIIISDNPSAHEVALAADIVARANLESLAVDFSLILKESEVKDIEELENPVLIGGNLKWIRKLQKEKGTDLPALTHDQGLVSIVPYGKKQTVALLAGSEEALLQTGRAFFLRWPHLWEIWGQEEGITYFSVENDISLLLKEEGIEPGVTTIRQALYEFPQLNTPHQALKRLKFNSGEIKSLLAELKFSDKKQKEKAFSAFEALRLLHQKGQRTNILNYPGCSELTIELRQGNETSRVILPRMGYPRRILTPSFEAPYRPKISGKNFDLLNIFSAEGFYADSDRDSISDTLDACVIIPQGSSPFAATYLASRLVLNTAGASFPVCTLDKEIEDEKALVAPILVGNENKLNQELVKKGKLKMPRLERSWGMAKVVPEAFNKSNALTVIGADSLGLEKILSYMSRTFPFMADYREGEPSLADLPRDIEKFLKGESGSAEAYFDRSLKKTHDDLKGKDIEYLKADVYLHAKNQSFEQHLRKSLENLAGADRLEVKSIELRQEKTIFEKEKEFLWEADEAFKLIEEKAKSFKGAAEPVTIILGLSESPKIRQQIKSRVEALLIQNDIKEFEVKVLSAYKQGFFWLVEEILPSLKGKKISRLVIRFAEEKEDLSKPKRFYSEPFRWLQELYPADEIISQEITLPLDRIEFEMKKEKDSVYEVLAYGEKNDLLLERSFSPRTREALFLKVLPEWGTVRLTTGWVRMEKGKELLLDETIKSDLEKFWEYYQDEILPALNAHVMKKTGSEPTFAKQPYFKRLLVEMWFSEPDYRLGLDEEIISSLEAIHDELYFDTLDFLRGITEVEVEEEAQEDTSRYSAPGNVLPLVHPSLEGGGGKVKVMFEDWQAQTPTLELKWKEKGKEEQQKKIVFPALKTKTLRLPCFIYNGQEERIENLYLEAEFEKESEYLTLIDLLESYRALLSEKVIAAFDYPKLKTMTLTLKFKDLEKEESLLIYSKEAKRESLQASPTQEEAIVPTDKIISPQMCLDIVRRLSSLKPVHGYFAGRSYENREIPVLEIFTPMEKYISLARLVTFKPTLYLSARQHANEISSTNYILKLAELLAMDRTYQEYTKKMNFVLHPMENPDGAELAYELQKLTPFHSLHAGRYSSLGIDIGYQVGASKPLLPEAEVRKNLYGRWTPDIYLNLHGYPSHEWVQQFSGYSPYLFRDYWIPRGWFAFYRSLSLPIYEKWKEAAEELRKFITEEMKVSERISSSNKKFYERYLRWASRWQPHLNTLELYDGLNLYIKRRSSQENRLSPRSQMTFVEETPELMDETAQGEWLGFLCEQGLAYLTAHIKYLSRVKFEKVRIEEEIRDKIVIRFSRSRPGKVESKS